MIRNILGQRLKIAISSRRCSLCGGEFKEGSIIGGEDFLMIYSEKRFFSLTSKARSVKPLVKNFSAPLLNSEFKKNKAIFVRNTMSQATTRKIGNLIVALLKCERCSNEHKIEINIDNINNLCSK